MNNTQNHRQDAYYEQPEQVTEEDRARIARPMTYASGSFSRVDSTRFYPGCSTEQANMSSATGPVNNHSMPRAMDSPREGVNPYPGPYSAGVSYSHTYAPPMGQNVVPGPYSAYVQPTGPNVVHGAHPMYAPGSRPPSAYTAQPFTTGPPMQAYPPSNGAPDLRRLSINGPQSPASSFPSVTQMRPSPQGPPMMQTYGTARPIRASVTSGPEIVGRPGTSGSASPSQPDEGNSKLDANFRVPTKSRNFFKIGKVFKTLWAEPAGEIDSDRTDITGISTGSFGEPVFSKVRPFVVIGEGRQACLALPIMTYGGQGVSKKQVEKSQHAIIYTGKVAPGPSAEERPARGELGLLPQSIRVDPDEKYHFLDPMSRVDFAKTYTIQHNIKVRSIGKVNRDSMSALQSQYKAVWSTMLGTFPLQVRDTRSNRRIRVGSTGSSRPEVSPFNTLLAYGLDAEQARAALVELGLKPEAVESDEHVIHEENESDASDDVRAEDMVGE